MDGDTLAGQVRELTGTAPVLEAFIAGEMRDAQIAGIYSFAEAAQALRHAGQTGEARSGKLILTPT